MFLARIQPRAICTFGWNARRWQSTTATTDPLRILFCGSDRFSCQSLKALHAEHVRNPALVESIDVMVRPPKKVGRGREVYSKVPVSSCATELGLKVHEHDKFHGWELPSGINMIVAVSFGLFVPPRILRATKYGGLNIHPSLLPRLRGSAPIQHAIIQGHDFTGVSLQTLDEKAFDHGVVLAQTPAPGIPITLSTNLGELTDELSARGAELLVEGLRQGVYLPPVQNVVATPPAEEATASPSPKLASKITTEYGRIDWKKWKAVDFQRRCTALGGSVWTRANTSYSKQSKRVKFFNVTVATEAEVEAESKGSEQIDFANENNPDIVFRNEVRVDRKSGTCFIEIDNGSWVRVPSMLSSGSTETTAALGLQPYFKRRPRKMPKEAQPEEMGV